MTNADISRRQFLASVAAVATRALTPAQTTASNRIHVHHHIAPPSLLQGLGAQRMGAASANWSPARGLEDLEPGGVSAGTPSIAAAGGPCEVAADACRLCV